MAQADALHPGLGERGSKQNKQTKQTIKSKLKKETAVDSTIKETDVLSDLGTGVLG